MRNFVAALGCLALAACGLATGGTSGVGGGDTTDTSDASQGHTADDAAAPGAETGTTASGTAAGGGGTNSCDPAPAGWTRVAYMHDRNAACPNGSTSSDLVENPTAGAGACACGTTCTITQHQSCATGDVTNYY